VIREPKARAVSQQQRDALDQLLQDAPLDLGGDVAEQRVIFEGMMAAVPVPDDVTTSAGNLGGIPVVNVEAAGADHASVIFYLRGGAYAIGTAASSVGLASDLARRAGARLVTVDHRLAPEHPHAAGVAITLQVTPGVPHVFQGFAAMLDEGDAARPAPASSCARTSVVRISRLNLSGLLRRSPTSVASGHE
jgi:alpha/beta hydrolase fold